MENQVEIASMKSDIKHMASDISDIKELLKHSADDTRKFLDELHKQNERTTVLELKSKAAEKKINEVQARVECDSDKVSKVEKRLDSYYYKVTGAALAGSIITGAIMTLSKVSPMLRFLP